MENKSIISLLSKNFAVRIVFLCKFLLDKYKQDKILPRLTDQILRSGTSIGANIQESINAVSDADYVNKLGIALKEADETKYWLDLLFETKYLNRQQYTSIYNDNCKMCGALVNCIKSKKMNM